MCREIRPTPLAIRRRCNWFKRRTIRSSWSIMVDVRANTVPRERESLTVNEGSTRAASQPLVRSAGPTRPNVSGVRGGARVDWVAGLPPAIVLAEWLHDWEVAAPGGRLEPCRVTGKGKATQIGAVTTLGKRDDRRSRPADRATARLSRQGASRDDCGRVRRRPARDLTQCAWTKGPSVSCDRGMGSARCRRRRTHVQPFQLRIGDGRFAGGLF